MRRSKEKIKLLRKWLIDLEMTQEEIARKCGITQSMVGHVIAGRRRSRKVEDYFLSKGCPKELLATEEDDLAAAV